MSRGSTHFPKRTYPFSPEGIPDFREWLFCPGTVYRPFQYVFAYSQRPVRCPQSVYEPYTRAFALFCKIMAHLHWIKNKITNFAASEGRNPWVKNAFLALSYYHEIGKISKEGWRQRYVHSVFVYDCTRTASRCTFQSVYKQRGVFVLLFISLMVFADTSDMMSVTSPYAFLVSVSKHIIDADFGGLGSNS